MLKTNQIIFIAYFIMMCSISYSEKAKIKKQSYKTGVCCCDIFTTNGLKEVNWLSYDGTCNYHGCVNSRNICSENIDHVSSQVVRENFRNNIYIGLPETKPCCCTVSLGINDIKVHWTNGYKKEICNFKGCKEGTVLTDKNCLEAVKNSHSAVWNDKL
jgi:hypothetical protein